MLSRPRLGNFSEIMSINDFNATSIDISLFNKCTQKYKTRVKRCLYNKIKYFPLRTVILISDIF